VQQKPANRHGVKQFFPFGENKLYGTPTFLMTLSNNPNLFMSFNTFSILT